MRFVKTVENLFGLPAGFQRVETIESTGTQYIDTGVDAKTGLTIEVKIKYVSHTGIFCGAITTSAGTGDRYYAINFSQQNKVAFTYLDTAFTGSTNLTAGNIYTIKTVLGLTRQEIFVDGVSKGYTTKTDNVDLHWTLGLFALHRGGSFTPEWFSESKAILYYCKIWDGDTLVRDYIPCLDPFGVPCMYDLVGKKPYYNQGTGEFTVGRQIIPVEYLQSTGTQYINTGYAANVNTIVEYNFNLVEVPTSSAFFGSGTSNTSTDRFQGYYESSLSFSTKLASTTTYSDVILTAGTKHYSKMGIPLAGYYIDDTFIASATGTPTSLNLYVFARNINGSMQVPIKMKLYDFKISENNALIRDYIPCKDENDNGFLFDKVSGVCYLNNGTDNFAFGENKYKMKLRLIKDNILPTGYTQVEYLESSGTHYIDIGIKSTVNMSVKTKFNLADVSSKAVFGSYSGSASNGVGVFFGTAGGNISGKVYCNNTNIAVSPDLTLSTNTDYEIEMSGTSLILNNSEYTTATTADNNYNMILFARSNNGTIERNISGKIYYLTIKDNNTLVRNFIPAIDPSGTPCMYDLVTRTPFYNAGTGTFITGKPVLPIVRFPVDPVPVGYKTVNYLGSDSTAYIDTGVSGANDNLKIEMDFSYSKFYAYGYFFSNYESEQYDTTRFLLDASNNSRGLGYVNTKSQNGAIYTSYNLTMNDKHSLVLTKTTCSLDGLITTNTNPPAGTANTKNIILFNRGAGSYTDKRDIGMRCWSFKIYDNNTIIRNFIPVVRRVDKVAGMWDTVTKQFFTTPVGAFNFG